MAEGEETGQLKEIFQKWDRDGSGDISVAELTRVLTKLNPQLDEAGCQKMFSQMDVNSDGSVQYGEFINWLTGKDGSYQGAKAAIMMDQKRAGGKGADAARKAKLRAKYAKLDKNGDGKLDFVEVYDFLQKRYPNMTLPDLRFLYNCADKSHDGILDFYELLDVMMSVPAQKADPKAKAAKPTQHPLSMAIMRKDARDDIEAALAKENQDHEEWLKKVNEMSEMMQGFKDEEKRHKEFRDAHAKVMREHYAKTGQLAI
ncbi:unnamed protein product [Effrenium voratum]|nr:unnamed protein product [Effrenium voratum]|mmetsp:Transcript_68809/g.163920  ORF Transcript_68809/g.163920 Transcript_68809/m.163920 type:complete len:258 (-) Transcript_68809:243-1016(-)